MLQYDPAMNIKLENLKIFMKSVESRSKLNFLGEKSPDVEYLNHRIEEFGITNVTLGNWLNGKSTISAEHALKLERRFPHIKVEDLRPYDRWIRIPDPAWEASGGRPLLDLAGSGSEDSTKPTVSINSEIDNFLQSTGNDIARVRLWYGSARDDPANCVQTALLLTEQFKVHYVQAIHVLNKAVHAEAGEVDPKRLGRLEKEIKEVLHNLKKIAEVEAGLQLNSIFNKTLYPFSMEDFLCLLGSHQRQVDVSAWTSYMRQREWLLRVVRITMSQHSDEVYKRFEAVDRGDGVSVTLKVVARHHRPQHHIEALSPFVLDWFTEVFPQNHFCCDGDKIVTENFQLEFSKELTYFEEDREREVPYPYGSRAFKAVDGKIRPSFFAVRLNKDHTVTIIDLEDIVEELNKDLFVNQLQFR